MHSWLRRLLQVPDTTTHVPTAEELATLPVGVHPDTGEEITLAESELLREFVLVRSRALEHELREYQALQARLDRRWGGKA